ncbi:MAG: leucyl aminopeptidase family protein [Alphaproteobacteria bacterium]|nr:leucyl aminopeptidase family protein [Alphaproteobacteria bacterium]
MPLIASSPAPRALHIMDSPTFADWLDTAPGHLKNWVEGHGFSARKNSALVLPAEDGAVTGAVIGSSGDAYVDGAMASRLPAGAYQLQGELDPLVALGFALDQYRFDRFQRTPPKPPMAELVVEDAALRDRLNAIAEGVCLTRDLINLPANHLTPQGLEDHARQLAKTHGAAITVTIGEELAQQFPAIHVVGRAAEVAPRLLDLSWGDQGPLITLIGKGITFDSGGLDLKPSSAMEMMKKDMGGSAHVLGLAHTIMALGLKLRLRVLVPAAENAVSALSMRPLDVIDTAAGIPVEVGNTDAEGRLVLADAFHLATNVEDADLPALMIDFATLTGAARVAVGTELPALFSNDNALSQNFIAAGNAVGDPLWPLPLHDPYDRYLDGGHAALSSTGTSRYGGAITAALFLQRFLKKPVPWAHIDVMAWNLGPRPGHPKGGEAMGLRAALELIEQTIDRS